MHRSPFFRRIGPLIGACALAAAGCAGAQTDASAPIRAVADVRPATPQLKADSALRTCPIGVDKPVGQNAWGLSCVVAVRLSAGTSITMRCWVDTYAPSDGPSRRWFAVTVASGPSTGEQGWVWSDLVDPQIPTPRCDAIGHEKDPAPAPSPLPQLVFSVVGSCSSDGGTLFGKSSGFSPGGSYGVAAWYPDGRAYPGLRGTGTVDGDGSVAWTWPCAGDPSGTYGTELVDEATGAQVRASFTIAPGHAAPDVDRGTRGPTAAAPSPDAPKAIPPVATAPRITPPPSNTPPAPTTRVLSVYNRVTNGASAMREDTPAYLSTRPSIFCKRSGCAIPGTDVGTGARLTAVCWTSGDRTTNGQDNSAVDDRNPGLYTSTEWYRIMWTDGRQGYLSEVWLAPADRGDAGLPAC